MKFLGTTQFRLLICALLTASCLVPDVAHAQNMSQQRLASVIPDEQDLQGFFRVVPDGEALLPEVWSQQEQKWVRPESPAIPAEDYILTDQDTDHWSPFWRPLTGQSGKYSIMSRTFWSADGKYRLEIRVAVCDSEATAHNESEEIYRQSQVVMTSGMFYTSHQLGDESWVYSASNEKVMRGRCGKLLFMVSGQPSEAANRSGTEIQFPSAATEAVAYQILLRASQQPQLTGVSVLQARMDVNSHALPKNALQVAGQTYVPVTEFAKAMGMTTRWNTKTGALTLSGKGRKTVTLTADSTAASVGGAKAALTVPVLKQDGQPVMTLTDLLTVTGGRITGHSGNNVQVKG